MAGAVPCGEKGFQAAARAEGLGEPKKDRRFATGAGAWIGLQRKRIGKDERSPAAVAGMQSFGEGLRRRARVGGAVKERTLGRPQEGQRAAGARVGQEIFRMPVFDIGGDTMAGREQAGADPVRNFVVNEREIGGVPGRRPQQVRRGTEGLHGKPAKTRGGEAGESEAEATGEDGGALAGGGGRCCREKIDGEPAKGRGAEEGDVGRFGGGVVADAEYGDIETGASKRFADEVAQLEAALAVAPEA